MSRKELTQQQNFIIWCALSEYATLIDNDQPVRTPFKNATKKYQLNKIKNIKLKLDKF